MRFESITKVFAALALVTAASAVTAASTRTFDLGTLGTSVVGQSDIQVNGSFDDLFKFVAGSLPGAVGSMVGIDGSASGDLTLSYRFGVGATPVWGSWSASTAVPQDENGAFSLTTAVNTLTAGQTYWANLTGSASSAAYSVTLLPVPEPESYAMLLVGLGLMGVIARRRNRNNLEN